MAHNKNGIVHHSVKDDKKSFWIKTAGGLALLGAGLLLYRKRQRMIGGALITSSVKILTGLAV